MNILDMTMSDELTDFGKRMSDELLKSKKAIETWWAVLESYGVTLEELNEVSASIDAGTMTRREGWIALGLPVAQYPGLSLKECIDNYNTEAERRIAELLERDRKKVD